MTVESVLARIHLDPPNEAVALTLHGAETRDQASFEY